MSKRLSPKNTLRGARRYFSDTSVKTKLLYLRRTVLRRIYPPVPRQLLLSITYLCQCECVHCCLGPMLNNDKDELDKQEIYSLIDTAKKLGFLEIGYFGGEPLLRRDIVDFIRFSSSKGLLTSIYTNGILLNKKKVKELSDAGLFQCNVSLDSASSKSHNSLRGYEGCFEKAMEGIRNLIEAGIRCDIWTYASKRDVQEGDLKDLKGLIELGRRFGVSKVFILFPMASGNWLCGGENILTKDEREKVRAYTEKLSPPPDVVLEFPSEDSYCPAAKRMAYITPQGDLSPCPSIPHYVGNIRKESLRTILNRMNREFVDSKQGVCGECVMNEEAFRKKVGIDRDMGVKKLESRQERKIK